MNRPSPLIRWLHAAVAISVLLCLVSALIMNTRTASTTFTGALFVVHKYVGINLGILLVCYLALSKYGVGKSLGDLWPWFSPRKLRLLMKGLIAVAKGDEIERTEPVATAVQGIGLTTVFLTVILGIVLFSEVLVPDWLGEYQTTVYEWHEGLSYVIWSYIAVHVGATAKHSIAKERDVIKMLHLFSESMLSIDERTLQGPQPKQEPEPSTHASVTTKKWMSKDKGKIGKPQWPRDQGIDPATYSDGKSEVRHHRHARRKRRA